MKAIEFLKQHRVYEDETIYNSVGEIVGTVSQLMEEYAALRQPPVVGRSEQLKAFAEMVANDDLAYLKDAETLLKDFESL